MVDPVRQEVIALAHTVVVKVGTNVLTGTDGSLDSDRLQVLADQVQRIRQTGRKVALVSSGAIGAGLGRLDTGCIQGAKCGGLLFRFASNQGLAAIEQERGSNV